MTAGELYDNVLRHRIDASCYPFSTFIKDLDYALNIALMEAMGLSSGSKLRTHEICIRTRAGNLQAGQVGYLNKYWLPADLLRIERVELNLDGQCWREASYVNYADSTCSLHKDKCNDCQACFNECKPQVVVNERIIEVMNQIKVDHPCGIKLWYKKINDGITEESQEIPINKMVASYVEYIIVLRLQEIDADKYSATQAARTRDMLARAQSAFVMYYQGEQVKIKSLNLARSIMY